MPVTRNSPPPAPHDRKLLEQALSRAERFHVLRVAGSEDAITPELREYVSSLPHAYPIEVAPGWWLIGSIHDVRDGGFATMPVWWHPETNRVKLRRPPEPPGPEPPPPPLSLGYRTGNELAQEGFIYTWEGKDYLPSETEVMIRATRSLDGWTWRPGRMIAITVTPRARVPQGSNRPPTARVVIHPAGSAHTDTPRHVVSIVPLPGEPLDRVAARLVEMQPWLSHAPDDLWEWEHEQVHTWAQKLVREVFG